MGGLRAPHDRPAQPDRRATWRYMWRHTVFYFLSAFAYASGAIVALAIIGAWRYQSTTVMDWQKFVNDDAGSYRISWLSRTGFGWQEVAAQYETEVEDLFGETRYIFPTSDDHSVDMAYPTWAPLPSSDIFSEDDRAVVGDQVKSAGFGWPLVLVSNTRRLNHPTEWHVQTTSITGNVAVALGFATLVSIARIGRFYHQRRRGRCVRCGYELSGLVRCPECGLVPRVKRSGRRVDGLAWALPARRADRS